MVQARPRMAFSMVSLGTYTVPANQILQRVVENVQRWKSSISVTKMSPVKGLTGGRFEVRLLIVDQK